MRYVVQSSRAKCALSPHTRNYTLYSTDVIPTGAHLPPYKHILFVLVYVFICIRVRARVRYGGACFVILLSGRPEEPTTINHARQNVVVTAAVACPVCVFKPANSLKDHYLFGRHRKQFRAHVEFDIFGRRDDIRIHRVRTASPPDTRA